MSTGNFRVLYNTCYGGFSVSDEAMQAYNVLSGTPARSAYQACDDIESRSDSIWLQIFDTLGSQRFSGPCAKIDAAVIDERYRGYVSVSEYDGMEEVRQDEYTYLIHSILKSMRSDADKVAELKKIFGL